MEHVRDVVNKFLGQAHAPVVDGGGDEYEVNMFLRLSFLTTVSGLRPSAWAGRLYQQF